MGSLSLTLIKKQNYWIDRRINICRSHTFTPNVLNNLKEGLKTTFTKLIKSTLMRVVINHLFEGCFY